MTSSGSEEAATSKRRWIALDTLLTFWPPAPWARTAVSSTSDSSMVTLIDAFAAVPAQRSPGRASDGVGSVAGPTGRTGTRGARPHISS